MTSCLWSKFAEFKHWGWRCTLWWWKRHLQSWYAFLHKGLHAWQVQCLTNTFFNVCWWDRLDGVVYNARRRDGTILGGDDGCSSSRQESNSNVEVETNRQTLFCVSGSKRPVCSSGGTSVCWVPSTCHLALIRINLFANFKLCLETQHLVKFNFG